MKYQRQSDIPKKGSGPVHDHAEDIVVNILEQNYFKFNTGKNGIFKSANVYREWPIIIPRISAGHGMYETPLPPHNFDIVMDLYYNNGIHRCYAVEIDGKSHDKEAQIQKDLAASELFWFWSKRQRDFDETTLLRIHIEDVFKSEGEPEALIKLLFK